MQLWNDYEGKTIDGSYPLEKLISPEGRSAFFSTHNGTGAPALVRLIESHFDEAEILERWRKIADLQAPHLIALRKFGQTELDGTSIVYAVMEPSDGNLAEVLQQRPLTVAETRDLATSLVAALQTLHSHNFIHEHIQPANILAIGEVIKLRSDCVRELPSGEEDVLEAMTLRAKDVRDLAVVLLQALTLRDTMPRTPLPAPFDTIVRNGMNGTLSLNDIAALLPPPAAPQPPATAPVQPPATAPARPAAAAPAAAATNAAPNPTGISATPISATPKPASLPPDLAPKLERASSFTPKAVAAESPKPAPRVSDRLVSRVEEVPSPSPFQPRGFWIAGAVAAVLLIFLIWRHFSSTPAAPPAPITTLATPEPAATSTPTPAPTPEPPAAAPGSSTPSTNIAASAAAGNNHANWRVVVFTYNRQDQAQKKAEQLSARYAALHPEVFSPTGHAPFLVTLGGPMGHDQAAALKKRARSSGLPRDTYIQNYSH
jgi:eukaryotic-like serine/threonine-protein kinase